MIRGWIELTYEIREALRIVLPGKMSAEVSLPGCEMFTIDPGEDLL